MNAKSAAAAAAVPKIEQWNLRFFRKETRLKAADVTAVQKEPWRRRKKNQSETDRKNGCEKTETLT